MSTRRMSAGEPELPTAGQRSLLESLEHPSPAFARLLAFARSAEGRAVVAATPRPAGPATAALPKQRVVFPRAAAPSSAKSAREAQMLLPLVVDYANGLTQIE